MSTNEDVDQLFNGVSKVGSGSFWTRHKLRLYLIVLLVVLAVGCVAWGRDLRVQSLPTAMRVVHGRVVVGPTAARQVPDFSAPVVALLEIHDRITVTHHSGHWFGIVLVTKDGALSRAWVEKRVLILDQKPSSSISQPKQGEEQAFSQMDSPKVGRQQQATRVGVDHRQDDSMTTRYSHRLSLAGLVVFDGYQYGALQYGLHLSYGRRFGSWVVALPLSFATGDSFKIAQVGFDIRRDVLPWQYGTIYVKSGALLGHLYGSYRSLQAVSVEVSVGSEIRWSSGWGVFIEPVSAQAMVWINRNVPYNIRGQVVVGGLYQW